MFRSKTIFVVGAGASCELGFPNGTELLGQIASALDIYFGSGFNMERGDRRIYEAYTRLSTSAGVAANEYQQAGWRIRDAAHLGLSIDNVINQFVDDPLVAPVGKLAIAQRILFAEQRSVLRLSRDRVEGVEALAQARTTWLGGFAQLLVQDKTRARLDDLFDNVSIVSFNYDRSIRRFLPLALMSQFGLPQPDANELTKKLQIYHPYGSLGPLPWENTAGGAEYGDAEYASLIDAAGRLRTFTEQIEDGEELTAMRQSLSEADRVVFLGFGYHRQNMALLSERVEGSASHVYGTAMGLSEADKSVVTAQLGPFFRPSLRNLKDPVLPSLGCVQFINEYFRALTA